MTLHLPLWALILCVRLLLWEIDGSVWFGVLIPAMHARAGQSYFHRHIAPARVPSLDSAPMQFTDRIILLEHVSLHFVTTLLQ